MFPSNLKKLLAATAFGAVLATGVGAAEEGSDGASVPPTAPAAAPVPRHHKHRGPIDLAKANERAAHVFEQADKNADGQITEDELAATDGTRWMRGHRKHHERMPLAAGDDKPEGQPDRNAQTFASLDSDGNGQLSAEEFARIDAVRREQRQRHALQRMDVNGDGVLSKEEFPPFTARLNALDVDHDGQVTRDEMRAARGARIAPPVETPAADAPPANG